MDSMHSSVCCRTVGEGNHFFISQSGRHLDLIWRTQTGNTCDMQLIKKILSNTQETQPLINHIDYALGRNEIHY